MVVERCQQIIEQIKQMESDGKPKEHIELVAQQARAEIKVATLLPPMHPTILEFIELLEKYLVE